MTEKIRIRLKEELEEFEKTKFEKQKELENANTLIEQRINLLRMMQIINQDLAEQYITRLKKKYQEEEKRLIQNLNEKRSLNFYAKALSTAKQSGVSMKEWERQTESAASSGGSNNETEKEERTKEREETDNERKRTEH